MTAPKSQTKALRNRAPQEVKQDTPLRLATAAAIAFPDGSMSGSGVRREATKRRLLIERIAWVKPCLALR